MTLELIGAIALIAGGLMGGVAGYFIRKARAKNLVNSAEAQAQKLSLIHI